MSGLRERLARLRGTAGMPGAASAGRNGGSADAPGDPEREEAGEAPQRADSGSAVAGPGVDQASSRDQDGGDGEYVSEAWERLGVRLYRNAFGAYLARRLRFAADFRHGRYALGELAAAAPELAALATAEAAKRDRRAGRAWARGGGIGAGRAFGTAKPSLPGAEGEEPSDNPARAASSADGFVKPNARELLFLDTETTGLGIGAGNVPFLIGAAYWEGGTDDHLAVEQLFMRHPGEEPAVLARLSELLEVRTHLVTYNGKSFDWPIVLNRFVLHRTRPDRAPFVHLDWLYPSRRLWRQSLESCRLGAVEEARLGVVREDDVPGSLAPELYVRYLADGRPDTIAGVFRHNERDLLSLVGLGIHFAGLLSGKVPLASIDSCGELLRLGRWLLELDRPGLADLAFDELENRPEAQRLPHLADLADIFKKWGRFDRAVRLWKEYAAAGLLTPAPEPFLELSMHYEHRVKDYREALHWARAALDAVRRRQTLLRLRADDAAPLAGIRKRIERLERKLGRSPGEAPRPIQPAAP